MIRDLSVRRYPSQHIALMPYGSDTSIPQTVITVGTCIRILDSTDFPLTFALLFPHFPTCCVESRLASIELVGFCHRPACPAKGLGTVQPPGVNFDEYEAIRCDSST